MSTSRPSEALDVAIVGQGRLGSTVSAVLESRGHTVHRVSRGDAIPKAAIIWLTVPDSAIRAVSETCPSTSVVLHASGASDLSVLAEHLAHRGSLHPLMTFPGGTLPPAPVPAAIAGSVRAQQAARQLALALGWTPFDVPGDRRAYHAAAVLAGNFATTLLAEAAGVLAAAGVDPTEAPALLAPLALQSLANAVELGPTAALTGPVVREDHDVIDAHRAVLSEVRPATLPMYEAMVTATRRLASSSTQENETEVD